MLVGHFGLAKLVLLFYMSFEHCFYGQRLNVKLCKVFVYATAIRIRHVLRPATEVGKICQRMCGWHGLDITVLLTISNCHVGGAKYTVTWKHMLPNMQLTNGTATKNSL